MYSLLIIYSYFFLLDYIIQLITNVLASFRYFVTLIIFKDETNFAVKHLLLPVSQCFGVDTVKIPHPDSDWVNF